MSNFVIVRRFCNNALVMEEVIHPDEVEDFKVGVSTRDDGPYLFYPVDIPHYTPPSDAGVIILLEEEYGFRDWVWESTLNWNDLKKFFKSKSPTDLAIALSGLEGVRFKNPEGYYLECPTIPGRFMVATLGLGGRLILPAKMLDWANLANPEAHEYKWIQKDSTYGEGHIHMDDDSFLSYGGETIQYEEAVQDR